MKPLMDIHSAVIFMSRRYVMDIFKDIENLFNAIFETMFKVEL